MTRITIPYQMLPATGDSLVDQHDNVFSTSVADRIDFVQRKLSRGDLPVFRDNKAALTAMAKAIHHPLYALNIAPEISAKLISIDSNTGTVDVEVLSEGNVVDLIENIVVGFAYFASSSEAHNSVSDKMQAVMAVKDVCCGYFIRKDNPATLST